MWWFDDKWKFHNFFPFADVVLKFWNPKDGKSTPISLLYQIPTTKCSRIKSGTNSIDTIQVHKRILFSRSKKKFCSVISFNFVCAQNKIMFIAVTNYSYNHCIVRWFFCSKKMWKMFGFFSAQTFSHVVSILIVCDPEMEIDTTRHCSFASFVEHFFKTLL